MDHYFSSSPRSNHDLSKISEHFGNETFYFFTDAEVFAKGGLDKGTRLLLESIEPLSKERVLDLGCGWGAIGIIISRLYPQADVHLSDINPRALSLSRKNAKANYVKVTVHDSDMFNDIGTSFDIILTNPPIRAGKKVIYEMIGQGYDHLEDGGRFYAVVRTKQGARSYGEELEKHFQSVEIVRRGSGYKVFRAVRHERR
ncbi:MAG TPA: methyltransferase [Candidatus Methanofastidiosa archaeon]|nr:methyltransferase [Candidatus Methanofastidiosa archaeon]